MTGLDSLTNKYIAALLLGDSARAASVVDQAMRDCHNPMNIYLDILSPAMIEIGEKWCRDEINVAQEHLATEITLAQMEKLRPLQQAKRRLGLNVGVACVEGEQHFLGALMVADAFRIDGWDVKFLGPNVPCGDLVELLKKQPVHALALSVTQKPHLASLRKIVADLNRLPEQPQLLAGGAALRGEEVLAGELEVKVANDPLEGVEVARTLFRPVESGRSLETLLRDLGMRIRELRIGRGWSQQELAGAASLDRTYILAIEHGKQNLTLGALLRLAEALGTPVGDLLT